MLSLNPTLLVLTALLALVLYYLLSLCSSNPTTNNNSRSRTFDRPRPLTPSNLKASTSLREIDEKMSRNAAAAALEQFAAITGATPRDAQRYLAKHKRVDVAVDAWFAEQGSRGPQVSTQKIGQLFDKYKDPEGDGETISVDGTIALCSELGVDPEDVGLLALAYELKSPSPGEWARKGWVDGLKALGVDNLDAFRTAVATLSSKLRTDAAYFSKVYNYTFTYVLPAGARSLGTETALAFWGILLPVARSTGAWPEKYDEWWSEYLTEKGMKGVSKDTWSMFLEFVKTIDGQFENYDETESWPSTIDDFVAYARERLGKT
ncbi:DUF298-domain-containing protein [Peniophora sp. CONT]|nr:DUF298-domain-containing protein [Peniophora sp. CONT]